MSEPRCLCGGPWPCPDRDAPNYRMEAYAEHGPAARADTSDPEGLRAAVDALPWLDVTLEDDSGGGQMIDKHAVLDLIDAALSDTTGTPEPER